MNAPAVNTTRATPILDDDIASVGDWREMLVLSDMRCARLVRENCELRAWLSRLAPLLPDWKEYDGWAAAAREYGANRKQRGGR
jgi:hypothetical protein